MAWNRPTLSQIRNRIEADIKSGLGIATLLRRSFLKVLASALAGAFHLLQGFLEYITRQLFVDTAETEFLNRHGVNKGVGRNVATFAEFNIEFTGSAGGTVPTNTVVQDSRGNEFTTSEELTLTGTTGIVKVIANNPGETPNPSLSDTISLTSPIASVNSDATVTEIVIDAEDEESDDSYRARILDFVRQPPSGGAANDYIQWARSIAGITRAWVLPLALGPGTVGVAVVEDGEDPISASVAKVNEVSDFIETVRPATANVSVFTPVLFEIDLEIELKPNVLSVQQAVEAELRDLIARDSAVEGSFKTPSETNDGKILLSKINEAISIAQGEEDHNITLINGAAPADATPSTNGLAVLGEITWLPLA